MTVNSKQDVLLSALSDPDSAATLYDCWSLLQRAPSKAADILMQFRDVSQAAKIATVDIQDAVTRFDNLKPRLEELSQAATLIQAFQRQVAATDEAQVLNRLNRLVELAERVRQLKKDGSFELMRKLLDPI